MLRLHFLTASLSPLLLAVAQVQPVPAKSPAEQSVRALLSEPVPSGKARIIFYRASAFVGAFMGCNVYAGDRKIVGLSANRYWVLDVEPGFHSFAASGSGRAPFQLQIGQGERRFAKCDFGGGIMARNPSLVSVSDGTFAKVAGKLKPAD